MKVALVYDRVNKWGGAERVLLSLHELFPGAPLYTSVYNPKTAGWADDFDVRPSFLQSFPLARSTHELYPLLMPLAFESFSFDDYDLVISITSEAAKGIITKPQTKHLCYCLTPTRYLWSGYDTYFANPVLRTAASPFVSYLRSWDKTASSRPDKYVGISQEVQKRIKQYYQRESSLVYPPVSLGLPSIPRGKEKIEEEDYYLVVSRLVPYKKIALAVEACTKTKRRLIVVGIGSELGRLEKIAGPSVTFVGSVSDYLLSQYYLGAKALIFPGMEDFGITMVESQAFGKPVIAYKEGGASEIVRDQKTGILFSDQTVESLSKALEVFESMSFTESAMKKQASKFSQDVFKTAFMQEVDKLFANS